MVVEEIVTRIYRCDLSEKEVDEKELTMELTFPVKFLTDTTEGRPLKKPRIVSQTFDLCDTCLNKALTISGQGAQGHNTYWINS